jgi:hypothetical protein
MKYNLSSIMRAAWRIFRNGVESFAKALRMAWANAKAHRTAKAAAGVTEETHTWSGWRELGMGVLHESRALYRVLILDPTTKSGTRVTCYFGLSQVQAMA